MEPRTFVYVLVAVVVTGAGGIFMNSFTMESTKNDLRLARAQLTSERNALQTAKDSIALDESKLSDLNSRRSEADGSNSSIPDMEEEIAKLQKKVEAAKANWASELESMQAAIQEVRSAAKGTILPEITLRIGAPLKDCTIIGYKEEMLSVSHETGTARLTAEQLPAELVDRFKIGWVPTLQISEEGTAESNGGTKPKPNAIEPIPEPPSLTEAVPPPTLGNVAKFEIEQRQKNIETLRVKIQAASNESFRQSQIAAEAQRKYSNARIQGRSSSQSVIADRAAEAAQNLQRKIREMEAQISRLDREISNLLLK